MKRRFRVLLILVFLAACDRGPGKPPGLEGARPLVADFGRVAKGLDDIAPAVAAWGGKGELPGTLVADMTEVGKAARAVLDAAEPYGDAGAAALSEAAVDAANDVVRHLVTVAGGREEKPGQMVLNPPDPVAFDTDDRDWPPGVTPLLARSRTELKIVARERLEDVLRSEIERFAYVALLVHPITRAALASRLSPDHLPVDLPGDRNLPATWEVWRNELFDDQNRLVVPNPADPDTYRAFISLTEVVSPDLDFAVSNLMNPVFRLVSG